MITEALKKAKKIEFLIELDFNGLIKRYAMRNISVPSGSEDDRFFEGLIMEPIILGSSYNLNSNTYSLGDVRITIANKDRLQDAEVIRKLDGGTGTIYLWTDSLTWEDIDSDGILFQGRFQKEWHDQYQYSFRLVDPMRHAAQTIPVHTINTETWPNHRTEGGAGSVAGLPQPIVYGDWPGGVPLKCVDTAGFKYLACAGIPVSADADYTATTENVYDKDGSVIAAANYTFYPGDMDGEGNMASDFDFTGDQAANEPLSCSIQGLADGSGEIIGTAGTLIEHPADILYHLLLHYSNLNFDDIDIQSIRTMRSLLPGLRFATIINSQTDSLSLVDRILSQCQCARIQRGDKIGVMVIDVNMVTIGRVLRFDQIRRTIWISKTAEDLICNDLKVYYALNPTTKTYEAELIRDRANNPDCAKSYYDYGARPQQALKLPDVQEEATAIALANRYITLHAYRHDIVTVEVPYWAGWDIREGNAGLLTIKEGSSADGNGWVDERCILLERQFRQNTILQTWWQIAA